MGRKCQAVNPDGTVNGWLMNFVEIYKGPARCSRITTTKTVREKTKQKKERGEKQLWWGSSQRQFDNSTSHIKDSSKKNDMNKIMLIIGIVEDRWR